MTPLFPIDPRPVQALVASLTVRGQTVSAVTRVWEPGDCARCRLCRECCAAGDVCLVLVNFPVSREDAAGLVFPDEGPKFNPFGRASLN